MWYRCLNPTCSFVFVRTGECDRCPDCGKQHLREAINEEIESVAPDNVVKNGEERKPSLDDVIKEIEANKPQPPKPTNKNGTPNTKGEISPGTHPVYQIPER